MDMEKLRKINELANTLREKGLTTSRTEAAHIAGNLAGTHKEQEFSNDISFNMDNANPLSGVSKPMPENKIEAAVQRNEDTKNYVDEKRLINILQEFTGVFEKKNQESTTELKSIINKQQERINELTSSLQLLLKKQEEIKTNMSVQKTLEAPQSVAAPPSAPMEEDNLVSELIGETAPQTQQPVNSIAQVSKEPLAQNVQASKPIATSERKKSEAPRSGGYDSNDVDVQKFFYFGGK